MSKVLYIVYRRGFNGDSESLWRMDTVQYNTRIVDAEMLIMLFALRNSEDSTLYIWRAR